MTFPTENELKLKARRWTALLISPVFWTVYFMVFYAFNETVCGLDVLRSIIWGEVSAAVLVMFLLTILTLAVTGLGVYLGFDIWRGGLRSEGEMAERDRFIGLAAMLMSGLFVILTLGMAAVIVVLEPC